MDASVLTWLVPLLRCPICREALAFSPETGDGAEGILSHASGSCRERYPVIGVIPRLVRGPERGKLLAAHSEWFEGSLARRALRAEWMATADGVPDPVVSAFDYEWKRFRKVGTAELATVFAEYFDLIEADRFAADHVVLDAGCGAGRWALEVARRGPRVIALDLGESIEVADRNTAMTGRVACVQADVLDVPLAPASVDWAYSLGVLHHVELPARALARIFDAVRPAGPVLTYLYYALDQRGTAYRALFRVANRVRRVISSLPRPLNLAFGTFVAISVYWPLARLALFVERLGLSHLASGLPLAYYRRRSLGLMLNDSLDRFGTTRELRFTRRQLIDLYESAGATGVAVSAHPPFWHAVGRRPIP